MRVSALLPVVALAMTPLTACAPDPVEPAIDAAPASVPCDSGAAMATVRGEGIKVDIPCGWRKGIAFSEDSPTYESGSGRHVTFYRRPLGISISPEDVIYRYYRPDRPGGNKVGPLSTVSFAGQEWVWQIQVRDYGGDGLPSASRMLVTRRNNLYYVIYEGVFPFASAEPPALSSADADVFASIEQSYSFTE